ncbi:hypothetical protein D3C73_1339800 [compost metagenome]
MNTSIHQLPASFLNIILFYNGSTLNTATQVTPIYTPLPWLLATTRAPSKVKYPVVTPKMAATGGKNEVAPVTIPAPPAIELQ